MLRIVLLSLVWAICATCLVRPWFWKKVTNGVSIGFFHKYKQEIVMEIICFTIALLLSMYLYALIGVRMNLYGSLPMIIFCFLAQCVWEQQRKICDIIF